MFEKQLDHSILYLYIFLSPDFLPIPDLKRFPRLDVVRPKEDENPFNAWAIKATVQTTNEELRTSSLLAGKRIVLKVIMVTVGQQGFIGLIIILYRITYALQRYPVNLEQRYFRTGYPKRMLPLSRGY